MIFGWFWPVFHSRCCKFSVQNSGNTNFSWEKLQRCVFDVFCKYEPESEKNLSSRGIICWDTKLVSFLVHDCMVLAVRGVLMFRVQKYQEIESVITLGHDDIGWQMSRSGLNSSLNVGFSFPWKFPLLSYGYRSRGSERWLSLYFIATIVSSP